MLKSKKVVKQNGNHLLKLKQHIVFFIGKYLVENLERIFNRGRRVRKTL